MTAWIISLMLLLQPSAPWRSSYASTAEAIASVVASEPPLYAEDDTRARTAATLVSVAWFESRFDVDAVGDHGAAHSLYQVHGPKPADAAEATRVALDMIRTSFRACKSREPSERLAWYASGSCDRGIRESRNRMSLARRLEREHPYAGEGVR